VEGEERQVSRVVVIGAGVGGLAVALRLAALGHRVTVVERAPRVGGKLASLTRSTAEGDFRFDTGPALLTLPDVFAELFAAAGARLDEHLDLVPLDPVVRHRFGDGTVLDSCADHELFVERIGAAFGESAARDWRVLWDRAERVWEASWRHVLTSTVDPRATVRWGRLARLARHRHELAAIGPRSTLRDVGTQLLRDPRLRTLLDRYATYAGADPRRAPAALVAIPYAELAFGGWYVRGGLATLGDVLLYLCIDAGVKVRTGTGVASVATAGRRVSGVVLDDGGRLDADLVVSDVDGVRLYGELLPRRRRVRPHLPRSLGGFVMLLGVRGAASRELGLAHHTVSFPAGDYPESYDAEFDAIFGTRRRPARPADDPTVYVSVADDPAVRPDGFEAWHVLVNAAPDGFGPTAVDWNAPGAAEAYADRILEVLASRGIDVRDRVLFREVRTPADLATATGSPGGAIYGSPAHGLLRPPNRGGPRGLFLVGGSVHPGGGLPMVALGARNVAQHVGPADGAKPGGRPS
jgi:phytoene desaturase